MDVAMESTNVNRCGGGEARWMELIGCEHH